MKHFHSPLQIDYKIIELLVFFKKKTGSYPVKLWTWLQKQNIFLRPFNYLLNKFCTNVRVSEYSSKLKPYCNYVIITRDESERHIETGDSALITRSKGIVIGNTAAPIFQTHNPWSTRDRNIYVILFSGNTRIRILENKCLTRDWR